MSDVLAVGALEAAAEAGSPSPRPVGRRLRRQPRGAGHEPAADDGRQPHEEKGRLAAQWLIEEIERGAPAEGEPRRTILPTELVVRESTAPPRS